MIQVKVNPIEKYLSKIDLGRCRTIFENRLIFVCGGKVDLKTTEKYSIRNMFMNVSGARSELEYILAENFKDWKDGYPDLSEFENDIAHISSAVVIILESAGSLAELGLFYANENIRSKLVVVVHNENYKSKSFIKFGILNPLEELDSRLVLAFDINHDNMSSVRDEEINDIVSEIDHFCSTLLKSEKFHNENRGHRIFLIFQIIDIFLALTKAEIYIYLETLNIPMQLPDISTVLFLLEKFGLIHSEKRSSQTFYYADKDAKSRVDLKFKDGEPRFDAAAIKIDVGNYFRESAKNNRSDHNRVRVIESINKKASRR